MREGERGKLVLVHCCWHSAAVRRRLNDLTRFYSLLGHLERRIGGRRLLTSSDGRSGWPQRGVYFFMEHSECRTDSGVGLRVVRVGTHALTSSSRTTLWKRLSQHKGQKASGGGNHRGSIFRLLVGSTLLKTPGTACPTWGIKNSAPHDVRILEQPFEQEVSRIIGAMPFLWLGIDDSPGAGSMRGYIERNAIALLSNVGKPPLDAPSDNWRGTACDRGKGLVRDSGLWNQNHVDGVYDPAFLDVLEQFVNESGEG
jgi:hypothetical protein